MGDVDPRPPAEIDLTEVVLRQWAPEHVPALTAAVVEALDHLRPWMVWATPEKADEAELSRFVADCTVRAADGREATYGIFEPGTGAVLGGVGLHDRLAPGGIEIGYWLHPRATGRGLMTRIVGWLTDAALGSADVHWVEVRCDRANVASAAVPERLGFRLADVVASTRPQAPADTGHDMIWVRTTPTADAPRR